MTISWLSFVQYSCKNNRLKANFVNYFLQNKVFSSAASVWAKLCHIKSIFCTSRRSDMSPLIRATVKSTSRKSRGIVVTEIAGDDYVVSDQDVKTCCDETVVECTCLNEMVVFEYLRQT